MPGYVILIIVATVMFVVIGGVTLFTQMYNLNRIKSKTVGDGQHGTARWATKKEIRSVYKHIPFTPERWRKQAEQGDQRLHGRHLHSGRPARGGGFDPEAPYQSKTRSFGK